MQTSRSHERRQDNTGIRLKGDHELPAPKPETVRPWRMAPGQSTDEPLSEAAETMGVQSQGKPRPEVRAALLTGPANHHPRPAPRPPPGYRFGAERQAPRWRAGPRNQERNGSVPNSSLNRVRGQLNPPVLLIPCKITQGTQRFQKLLAARKNRKGILDDSSDLSVISGGFSAETQPARRGDRHRHFGAESEPSELLAPPRMSVTPWHVKCNSSWGTLEERPGLGRWTSKLLVAIRSGVG
jgi:hypothetical protein